MPKPIHWSPAAKTDLEDLLDYLHQNWELKVAIKFLDQLELRTDLIQNNPKMFPVIHQKWQIRKCVITKHNALYYREKSDVIELIRL